MGSLCPFDRRSRFADRTVAAALAAGAAVAKGGSMSGWRIALTIATLAVLSGESAAKAYVPESDAVVLERLPEKGDPALAQLKRMRAALMANPARSRHRRARRAARARSRADARRSAFSRAGTGGAGAMVEGRRRAADGAAAARDAQAESARFRRFARRSESTAGVASDAGAGPADPRDGAGRARPSCRRAARLRTVDADRLRRSSSSVVTRRRQACQATRAARTRR